MNEVIGYILIFILGAISVIGFLVLRQIVKRRRLMRSLKLRLLLIKIPREIAAADTDLNTEINKSERLITILSSLESEAALEASVHHSGEEIHFYVAVPEDAVDFIMREVHGLWPSAHIEDAHEYNIFHPEGASSASYMMTEASSMVPLRTYEQIEGDTFENILSTLSKLEKEGEGAALQIILKKAPKREHHQIESALQKLKQGKKLHEITYMGAAAHIRDAVSLLDALDKKEQKAQEKSVDETAIKLLEAKISKPLFYANLRVVTSAATQERANALLQTITSSFNQFHAPRTNTIKFIKPRKLQNLIFQFSFRSYSTKQHMTLNTEELASLFHLPTAATNVPHIKWLKTKEAPPPVNLPHEGLMVGESIYRGERRPVRISEEDRRRHLYVIGQTGTGKSNFLTYMAQQDVLDGKGIAVVDPHGDLIEDILGLIPKERADDVIVFDPGDIERPIAMNMLEYDPSRPEEKTFIVNEMQAIFNRLFPPETMGPMFEQYMRNALLLLMEDREEPGTLMEVPRVFTDALWRREKIRRINNPAVVDFWEKEAAKSTGEHSLANMAPYITSKFNNFIANDYVRPIIAQRKSAFRFRNAMDDGKILLVNLSKGKIGDLNAGLLGMVIVSKLLMAALSRVDIPQEERKDFYLYIDEFQNFTTDSIAVILSEARKYRLDLTIAHQFIGQLSDQIRDAVFGNVGSMTSFRVGAQDAEFLAKQFDPVFSENDLINIDNFNAYAKILIQNETSRAFNIKIPPAPEGSHEIAQNMRQVSRLKYGQPREEIEADIMKRLREI